MVDLILKKKHGEEHTKEEIQHIIKAYVEGYIPDYQVSAWLMAVNFQGLTDRETAWLTEAMMHSGEVMNLNEIKGIKVDKHSTGGVGDKTTLVLAPLVAAEGVSVAKLSGRGLGHTGGTLDKLEAIPGFKIEMTNAEFINQVNNHGIAICGQNTSLVPADKKLYALRDVTGTVENISLICSSVMSKKLASGADAIVIDIKMGEGAFMKSLDEAERLGKMMIATAKSMGKKIIAVVSDMEQPLGYNIGNSLEVIEAVNTLKGQGPKDLTELCLELGSLMLTLANEAMNKEEAKSLLKTLIENGKAFEKFKELVVAQHGDVSTVVDTTLLPVSPCKFDIKSKKEGYINHLSAMALGLASVKLGAGREKKDSELDYGAGIIIYKKAGDYVQKGDILATMYAKKQEQFDEATKLLDNAWSIENVKPKELSLIYKTIF